jgi:predicted amidohydrolase
MRARAIETGSFVLAPAQGGVHVDGRATWGRSTAIDPWGRVIGKLDHDDPDVLVCDLDLAEVAQARGAIPALVNERAFAGP